MSRTAVRVTGVTMTRTATRLTCPSMTCLPIAPHLSVVRQYTLLRQVVYQRFCGEQPRGDNKGVTPWSTKGLPLCCHPFVVAFGLVHLDMHSFLGIEAVIQVAAEATRLRRLIEAK